MNRSSFDPLLYLVADPEFCRHDFADVLSEAAAGGVTMVQVRAKHMSTGDLVKLTNTSLEILAPYRLPLLVNDRVDVAAACGAHGVHLGQSDMPVEHARRILGPDAIIGLSIETLEQAEAPDALAADYLGVSPVFSTPTKPDAPAQWGLDAVAGLRSRTKKTLIGIGGITFRNATGVIAAGCSGIAVISAVCAADDPQNAAAALRKAVTGIPRK